MMVRRSAWAVATVAAVALAASCSQTEVLRPLPVETSSSSSSSGVGGAGGGGTIVRRVIDRDPMGNVQKTNNLLWDGDFEWQIAFQDQ